MYPDIIRGDNQHYVHLNIYSDWILYICSNNNYPNIILILSEIQYRNTMPLRKTHIIDTIYITSLINEDLSLLPFVTNFPNHLNKLDLNKLDLNIVNRKLLDTFELDHGEMKLIEGSIFCTIKEFNEETVDKDLPLMDIISRIYMLKKLKY